MASSKGLSEKVSGCPAETGLVDIPLKGI